MKKLVLFLLIGILPMGAMAAAKKAAVMDSNENTMAEDKSDGCGLGWQVTAKKSFLGTTTRGTTNAFVPPTFGMTSGTIGCEQHSFAKQDTNAAVFAFNNFDSIKIEMAEGQGETLQGFAKTMGCNDSAFGAFGEMTQQNYRAIIGTEKTSSTQMFQNVKSQIKKNAILSSNCRA